MRKKIITTAIAAILASSMILPYSNPFTFYVQAAEFEDYNDRIFDLQEELNKNGSSESLFWRSDDLLNEVYQVIKAHLSENEFSTLKSLELDWISERDAKAGSADDYWYSMTDSTNCRIYWLLNNYDYCFSKDPAGSSSSSNNNQTEVEPSTTQSSSESNTNHPELAAYREYLSNTDWIKDYTGNDEYMRMCLFDLNQDNVWELGVQYCGKDWGIYTGGVVAYGDGQLKENVFHSIDQGNKGRLLGLINESAGRYILEYSRGKAYEMVYQLSSNGDSENLGNYSIVYYDTFTDQEKEDFDTYSQGMSRPVWVDINSSNLDTYLGGDGMSTGTEPFSFNLY